MQIMLTFIVFCAPVVLADFSYYYQPDQFDPRTDLYCPNVCKSLDPAVAIGKSETDCCSCNSKAIWEAPLNESLLGDLSIEYLDRRGRTILLQEDAGNIYSQIIHTHGFMTELPMNLCEMQNLVKIDLSDNKLNDVTGISCASNLDTLILKGNLIRFIRNSTFASLSHLRYVDLRSNLIEKVEAYAFTHAEVGIMNALLSENKMTTVDISNVALVTPFCHLDYSNNEIDAFVNEGGFVMDDTWKYGDGGFVSLENNLFSIFPDFTELGLSDITLLGNLFGFGFDLRNAKWNCNAEMVPFLQLAEKVIRKVWRDYMNVTCYMPERLRGESIPKLVLDNRLNEFTSEIQDGCPFRCNCTYYPVINITKVNCSSRGLLHVPIEMPTDGYLDIDFSNNKISVFPNASYNQRVVVLDLRKNLLPDISKEAILQLRPRGLHLDLSDNYRLRKLTPHFKGLDSCNITFGPKTIECDCKSLWIKDWYETNGCTDNCTLKCNTEEGLVSALELADFLECQDDYDLFLTLSIIFSVFLVITAIGLLTYYIFRYEILIVLKSITLRNPNKVNWGKYRYDAYISLHDDNIELRQWTVNCFLYELNRAGYATYSSFIDAEFGKAVDEEIIDKLTVSRNFIIILSEEYIDKIDDIDPSSTTARLEWRYSWNIFRRHRDRRLIFINFDLLKSRDVKTRSIKAFLRLRKVIDFSNRKHNFMNEVKHLLGTPNRNFRGDGCMNIKFRSNTQIGEGKRGKTNIETFQNVAFDNVLDNSKPVFHHKIFFPRSHHGKYTITEIEHNGEKL